MFPVVASVPLPGAVFLHVASPMATRNGCDGGLADFVKPESKHPFLNVNISHLSLWGKQAVAFLGLLQVSKAGMGKFLEPQNSREFWGASQATAGYPVPKRTEGWGWRGPPVSQSICHSLLDYRRQGLLWTLVSQAGLGLNVSKGDLDLDSPASTS